MKASRNSILLLAVVLTVSLLSGSAWAMTYQEAPMFEEQVQAGLLPTVAERLPVASDIVVVDPVESIGQYGGTWRMVDTGPGLGQFSMAAAVEPLVRWLPDLSGYEPGLAKDWDYSDDGRTLTIYLREGVKWSDGYPFTTEDIMFWWDDLITNREYPESAPRWAWSGGERMDVVALDEYTIQFQFAQPYFTFHTAVAQGFWENRGYYAPKHYLTQFHPEYSDDGDYVTLREMRTDVHLNPEYPGLYAWMTESWDAARGVFRAVRNPYFWKVDTEGNQLPYIDYIEVTIIQDSNMIPLQASAGELDAQFRGFSFRDISLLMENQERGDYRVILWQYGDGGAPMIFINWDVTDLALREVFRNQNFRQAISYALDRQRINEIVFNGFGTIQNATMSHFLVHYNHPDGPATHERWMNAYAQHDPELAKQLLDDAGIVDLNGDGFRQKPDGSALRLLYDVSATDLQSIDALQLMIEDLAEVGINASVNSVSGELMGSRSQSGEIQFQTFGYGSEVDLIPFPDNVFPVGNTRFHPLTGLWQQTGGEEGEEPTGVMRELLDIYYEVIRTGDEQERNGLILRAIDLHIDEGPFIYAPVAHIPAPVIVKSNMRNVPEFGVAPNGKTYYPVLGPWAPGFPGTVECSQFYFVQ